MMLNDSEEIFDLTIEMREQLYSEFQKTLSFSSMNAQAQFEIIKGYVEKVYIDTLNPNFKNLHELLDNRTDLNLNVTNETLNSILKSPERISFIRHQLIRTLTCNTPAFIQASKIHKQLCTLEESTEYFVPNES